jgi:hypothetical protein
VYLGDIQRDGDHPFIMVRRVAADRRKACQKIGQQKLPLALLGVCRRMSSPGPLNAIVIFDVHFRNAGRAVGACVRLVL